MLVPESCSLHVSFLVFSSSSLCLDTSPPSVLVQKDDGKSVKYIGIPTRKMHATQFRKGFSPSNFIFGALTSLCLFYLLHNHVDGEALYRVMRTNVASGNQTHHLVGGEKPSCSIKDQVTNSTLGVSNPLRNDWSSNISDMKQFEKVYAIGLPERTDRRDRLSLSAHFQDVELEWMDAVKGDEMPEKSLPAVCPLSISRRQHARTDVLTQHWNPNFSGGLGIGHLGCWRSHVNAYRKYAALQVNPLPSLLSSKGPCKIDMLTESLPRESQVC